MTILHDLPNFGFIECDVPQSVLSVLKKEVNSINEKSFKSNEILAGNLENEYFLLDSKEVVQNFLIEKCKEHRDKWDPRYTQKGSMFDFFELETLWVNVQQKHEFNPPHVHSGDFSFVIWLNVPYEIKDEMDLPMSKKSRMPRAGMFAFQYSNIFGEPVEIAFPVDKKYEGKMFLFPSQLTHQVYPFYTSNDVRISVSGNMVGYM